MAAFWVVCLASSQWYTPPLTLLLCASQMRALIIEAILATDMSNHFEMVNKLKLKLKVGLDFGPPPRAAHAVGGEGGGGGGGGSDEPDPQPTADQQENLTLFMKNALHAADIGSVGKPWALYFAWAQRVFEEFFAQGDREREMGMQVHAASVDNTCGRLGGARAGLRRLLRLHRKA